MRNIIRYHGYRRITDEQESTQSAVVLDAGEIRDLPMEDIRVILRDADELARIAEVENTIKNRAKLSE